MKNIKHDSNVIRLTNESNRLIKTRRREKTLLFFGEFMKRNDEMNHIWMRRKALVLNVDEKSLFSFLGLATQL